MNDRLQHISKMLRPHRLRHEIVKPVLISFGPSNIVSQARDSNDDCARAVCLLFGLPDLAGGFEAVHDWHVEVEEHDVGSGLMPGRGCRYYWFVVIVIVVVVVVVGGLTVRFVDFDGFFAVRGEEAGEMVAVGDHGEKLEVDWLWYFVSEIIGSDR